MNNKYVKLIASILLDAIGFIPIPLISILWAPLAGYIMTKMYKGRKGKIAGIFSFLEELLPIDLVPTFTIMWIYTYVIIKTEDVLKN
ncbi:MAG: hypothetical protein ACI9JT_000612 [Polaribacter sp.]|jgi:hypothetical protein